jgi:hypothetical protein
MPKTEKNRCWEIFRTLLPFYGKIVTPDFLQKTSDFVLGTISDPFEIVVHPKAKQASVNKFPILDMNGVPINLPEDENYYPHPEALKWHKKEVFNKFSL